MMKSLFRFTLLAWCGMAFLAGAERPNIILIMVDDMGFSDLGYHGGEIETPNIDALAKGGVRFSQFYNSGRCCPTRATLMTGLHPHQVGIGHMTQSPHKVKKDVPPAYIGHLNRECATIADLLKDNGYATMMSGKWHLGFNDQDDWPLQRGYEKYYGCISGATRFFHPFHPRGMTFGNEHLEHAKSTTDEAFYTTDAFTDYGIRFMKEELEDKQRPMFLYLAYTAPHWPLQAFEDDIKKYRGKYKMGWDELRKQRYERQLTSGLISKSSRLSPRADRVPAWDSLTAEKQDEMDLKMAIYAAMIDRVDQNIGKMIQFLKDQKQYENTLILFLSDNGGCAEGGVFGRGNFYDIQKRNQENANAYGEAWANVSSTPFRLYKHYTHEGGAATPFFMHWPKHIQPQESWFRSPAQLIDVMPTLLDVAGAAYPTQFKGVEIPALDGISMRPAFESQKLKRSEPIFIEHENNASIRDGRWKLVGKGVSSPKGVIETKWELYDLSIDRTELNDLSKTHPERVQKMANAWFDWSLKAKVYPKKLAIKK